MKPKDLFRYGCTNLFRRKTRTALTALSMAVGVMCIVVLISVGLGYEQAYRESIEALGSLTKIDVTPATGDYGRKALLNDKALEAFRGIDGVEAVTPVYQQSAYIVSGNYVNMVRVYGIDMTTAERFMLTPERGVMAEDGTRLHPEVLFTDDVAAGLANKAKDWELAVDENGKLVDGDKIIAICAHALQQEGKLKKNTAVVTVMTNLGFFHFAKANQIATKATKVGDRYVLEEMLSGGYNIGGEQSGHIIFLDEATTGDGELSGIKLLEILKKSGKKMSELAGLMECFPQVLYNVTIQPRKKGLRQDDADIAAVIEKHTAILGDNGRILVRESGTEPLIRVMVEGKNAGQIEAAAQEITEQVKIFAAS